MRRTLFLLALFGSASLATPVAAQSLGAAALANDLPAPVAAELLNRNPSLAPTGVYPDANASDASASNAVSTREDGLLPFGANLFGGGFSNDREDGLNPNYRIQAGDRISVRLWGATDFNQSLSVDPQGNIFVPTVGPVRLGGVANSQLNARLTQAVRKVYTDGVRVYSSLDGSQPVAVYVTGYVRNPGRFAGIPSNSPLHFLDRAGGIDADRGSYRDIDVLRDGLSIARIDLYDFLLEGALPDLQFQDGDTVVVGRRGAVVAVTGDVGNSALFELEGDSTDGEALADLALLSPEVSHVGLSGIREDDPYSIYLPLEEFGALRLQGGDEISFRIDRHDSVIVVEVEGSHLGPSRFAVPRDTRLNELLDHVAVDPELADIDSISLKRRTIAERQKTALADSLQRLEARYLTASSQTDAESAIRAQEAQLIARFVENASKVEPNGRLVVAQGDGIANVLLQSGDTITIPARSDSILLSGEVLVSQAMLHERGMSARDYIEQSGGFGEQANTKRLVVVHPNGEVTTGKNPAVRPGDEIIVLPKVPTKNLQLAATIVDIVYKIAVAASVAINL